MGPAAGSRMDPARRPARRVPMGMVRLLAASLLIAAPPAHPQETELGRLDFPNSGSAEAQAPFLRGVLLLHNFHYAEAAEAFREAQRADPGFALAYWGEAMTHNHPVWNQQDREAARAALARLAPSREARRAAAPTARERAYLDAVETLYGEGGKAGRDTLYAEAMAELAEAHPDDGEASLFYALSLLGLNQGERDIPTYMRAGALALEAFRRDPAHPGAAHYAIHAFDDPVHAPLGLAAARAYAEIAPGAAHAQHMTSHIFVALGMWDETVAANEVATATDEPIEATGEARFPCGHYGSWLHYGYLQQGRAREARRILEECRAVVAAGEAGMAGSLAGMEVAHLIDAGDRGEGAGAAAGASADARSALVDATYAFLRAYAAVRRGALEEAGAALEAFAAARAGRGTWPRGEVLERMLRGLLHLAAGEGEAAVDELERAAELEDAQPVEFGPPPTFQPPHELLGEALLELGRPAEAREAFRAALARAPRRPLALLGLARAARSVGAPAEAAEAYAALAETWRRADPVPPGRVEAAHFLEGR